jgi:phage gp46-like protein
MADIPIIWSPAEGIGDWHLAVFEDGIIVDDRGAPILDSDVGAVRDGVFLADGGAVIGNDLGTAILISLFTDATAGDDDAIPDGSDDPRGWWGDLGADRPIGSRLWLRMRSKQTDTVLALVKDDITHALAWLVDDGVAARVDAEAEWSRPGMLGVRIVVHRADGSTIAARFDWAWKEV